VEVVGHDAVGEQAHLMARSHSLAA